MIKTFFEILTLENDKEITYHAKEYSQVKAIQKNCFVVDIIAGNDLLYYNESLEYKHKIKVVK